MSSKTIVVEEINDEAIDFEFDIDPDEYSRIMRRIVPSDPTGVRVSAFNSSI